MCRLQLNEYNQPAMDCRNLPEEQSGEHSLLQPSLQVGIELPIIIGIIARCCWEAE